MSSSASYCISKECSEPLCFKTRSILGSSVGSNMLENLVDDSTRCSPTTTTTTMKTVEDDIMPSSSAELKRLADIMRPKEHAKKRLSVAIEDGNISMETDGKDSLLMGDTPSTHPLTSSLPVTPALKTATTTAAAAPVTAPPILRDIPDLLPDKTYGGEARRESRSSQIPLLYSNRSSSLSTSSSSSSAMKLKSLVLKNNLDPAAAGVGGNNGKGNSGRLTVLCRRLDECAHFHYEVVDLKSIELSLAEDNFDDDSSDKWLLVEVVSKEKQWRIRKTFQSLHHIDEQLHNCIFKRKFSRLPELTENLVEEEGPVRSRGKICTYFDRLSTLPVSRINCGPILSWMEMDNRGNRVILPDSESAINIPAVGAAHSIKAYTAQSADELSLKVGDILSIIDKPPSNESNWWRGKKEFEVGFFPSDCVELLDTNKIPQSIASKYAVNTQLKHTSSIGRKNKLKSLLMSFFSTRPNRSSLKRTGIVKERLFACDLGEHLLNSSEEVPAILKCCAEVLEVHGIVDGIYRLSGAALTIHKLRNEFDEGRTPSLTSETYVQDIHSISSLLKMYFRELPNPLLTYQLYDKFIEAITEKNEELKPFKICDVVKQLPPPHYRTAEYLFRHLNRMASYDAITSMHCRNLAIVWAPNLLRSKELEQMKCGAAALRGVGIQAVVTEYLIKNVNVIFNEENQNSEDGISTADFSKMKVCTLMSATPRLLTLEEAQERKSHLVSSHLKQQAFFEVGEGHAAVPLKYHTVISFAKDKKKSPSRLKQLFRRSRSTSFKEDSNEGGKSSTTTTSSARDKKASSVRIEKSQVKSCNNNSNTDEEREGEKRNLSTSALLSNKTAAGNASFGILDDFKRLSTSCDIPPFPTDTPVNRTSSSAKKFKGKHRSTSVDITAAEVNCLLDSLQVEQNHTAATAAAAAVQHLKGLKRKSNGQRTTDSPLAVRQSHDRTSENDYVLPDEKESRKSKSQKKNNSLFNKPPRHASEKKKFILDEYEFVVRRDGRASVTDGNRTVDEEQLDKPVLASDESDFRSDSLETFEVIHSSSLKNLVDDVLSSGKSDAHAEKSSFLIDSSCLQSSAESSRFSKIDQSESESPEEKETKNANNIQMQLSNISNDLMAWSLSSDVTSKDLYKELSPTINNIWMESGCYTSRLSGMKSFEHNSQTAPELSVVRDADADLSESLPLDDNESGDASDIVIPSTSVGGSDPTVSGNDFPNTTSRKSDTIAELTDEQLRTSYSNFDTALNILEQSCDSKLGQDKFDINPLNYQSPSKSESDEANDQVFTPSAYKTAFDRINPKRNSIHCCLEIVPEKKSTCKSTPSINEEPPLSELSEAALDLFSFNRMYSSGSLREAKLQINNEDGYVYTSYKNLSDDHSGKPSLLHTSSSKDVPAASAPVISNEDGDILRRLVSCTSCTDSFGSRTVMMPVGSAAKKLNGDSSSSSQKSSVRNTAPPSELYPQKKESHSSSSRGRCSTSFQPQPTVSQASTDPLKRKESLLSYPNVSGSRNESFADKTDFLFRPGSSEKNSAFKHHHHRYFARHHDTPSPEVFSLPITNQSHLEHFGNASVRLTSREMKMWQDHHLAMQQKQQQQKQLDGWKSCIESKHAKPEGRNSCQQPSVIILNKPSSEDATHPQSRLSTPCYGTPRNGTSTVESSKSQNTSKAHIKPDRFSHKFSASHTATSTPHLDDSRNSSPAASAVGKNPTDSQVPFARSISLSEEDDEFLFQTSNFKRRIKSHNSNNDRLLRSAIGSFARPEERLNPTNQSALMKAAAAQRLDAVALKSSQQVVQPASAKSSVHRANQTFVTAKKQLFENNGNC